MNKLHLGFSKEIDLRRRRRYLYIGDEVPDIKDARVFDLTLHSINPLQRGLTHKQARELAAALYAIYPQGENTLTVRNGRINLAPALLEARRLDLVQGNEEITALIKDLTFSPLIKQVLCRRSNFSFNTSKVTLVRLNRAEIGDFDALVLGLIFINHFKGQLIIPDFGFYGRDTHINLIRENRLIAGLNHFGEIPLRLRQALLSVKDKEISGALYDDAETLAKHAGLAPHTNEYNDYVRLAMQ